MAWNRSHPSGAPGFSQASDPFAGLSGGPAEDEEIDFEDTYAGLGDELGDDDDAFNADTFGGASLGQSGAAAGAGGSVGTDFDFFGRTAKVSDAIEEEQLRYRRQQTQPKSTSKPEVTKPARTGYEKYRNPGYVADLEVDSSIWGQAAAKPTAPPAAQPKVQEAPSRKMMTLEEIEAQMAAGQTQIPQPAIVQAQQQAYQQGQQGQQINQHPGQQIDPRFYQQQFSPQQQPQILQRPQQHGGPFANIQAQQLQGMPGAPGNPMYGARGGTPQMSSQATQGLPRGVLPAHVVTHPQQLMKMSEEERAAFLAEDAKRAKRNHKIFLLSKDNGLMTPQDKNFITRIQLQQLMTATGGTEDKDPDAMLAEDFYYQVTTSIHGTRRLNPHQPLNHFAQTYLFQTGGRAGAANRRHGRVENHVQRMEQQVQRAVEAAKLKPKNKQLVLEGSLGKISFSNAKTPKPLLNIKKHESVDMTKRPASKGGAGKELTGSDRKSILRNIEVVYGTLMRLEDEARKEPGGLGETRAPEEVQQFHDQWEFTMKGISNQLWDELKVLEPINPDSSIPHPFIAFLSYGKGKKAIPRIFRYLSSEQRVTILTRIVLHLDILDVIRRGALAPGESALPADARESIDLFSMTVTPSLFGYVSEAPLFTIIGLLGLILDRVNVAHVARTKVGLGILTMLTSRATLIKEAGEAGDQDWAQWTEYYNKLFEAVQPALPSMFPPSFGRDDDVYVWQFLAAVGSGSTPEQQQALVIGVKDKVMETLHQSKTLPPDMASQKRANVNLFMRAIGLDVGQLE